MPYLSLISGFEVPRQTLVEPVLWMSVGDRGQLCAEIGEWLDAVDLAGLDQLCDVATAYFDIVSDFGGLEFKIA